MSDQDDFLIFPIEDIITVSRAAELRNERRINEAYNPTVPSTSTSSGVEDHMGSHGFQNLAHDSNDDILAAHFSNRGDRLVIGCADHRIRVLKLVGEDDWTLVDAWRGHDGEVFDVKWNGTVVGRVLGSVGEDLKLKIWQEDPSQAELSGRRFRCVFEMSSGYSVIYTSLDFINRRHESYLAVITRDGVLSLLEPVDHLEFNDWKEIDQVLVCDERIARGVDTCFKVYFQQAARPNYLAQEAGIDKTTLSMVVTAMDVVKIYRVGKTGNSEEGQYKFQQPVVELTGADGLVRDVAWSAEIYHPKDLIATAAADGYIRIYEVWTPRDSPPPSQSASAPLKKTASTVEAASKAASKAKVQSGIGAGLAGAMAGVSLADSQTHGASSNIKHDWALAEKIKHEGVWTVDWVPGTHTLGSTGDTGVARMWKKSEDGKWIEFAEFGPEDSDEQ